MSEVKVRVDKCSGGSDGLGQEGSMGVEDVEAVCPDVVFTNKRLGKYGAVAKGNLVGGKIVGVDVDFGRDKERGGFKNGDVVGGNELF